jgi:hypothetical protein
MPNAWGLFILVAGLFPTNYYPEGPPFLEMVSHHGLARLFMLAIQHLSMLGCCD